MPVRFTRKTLLALAICSVGAVGAVAAPAHAAIISYTGATDSYWYDGANWSGGIAPANGLYQDTALFDQTSYANQPVALSAIVSGIVVGDGTTNTAALTISGNSLTVGTGGISVLANAGAVTISAPITLGAGQIWSNASSNTLAINGVVTNTAGDVLSIQNTGGGSITSTTLADDATGILGAWATYGSGASTQYATISGGVLGGFTGTSVATANLLTSATTNYTLTGTGTLATGASDVTANTILATGAGPTIRLGPGTTSTNNLTLNGLTYTGGGTLTVNNNTTNTGDVFIGSSGELVLNAARGNITISVPIEETVAGSSVQITGSGTVSLAGTDTFTGGVVLNPGATLVVAAGTPLGIGGVFTINGGTLNVNIAGSGIGSNNMAWNGDFTFTGVSGNLPGAVVLGQSLTVTDNHTGNYNVNTSGVIGISDGGNVYGLTLTTTGAGAGLFNLQGIDTFGGPLTINGGTLEVSRGTSTNYYLFNQSTVITIGSAGKLDSYAGQKEEYFAGLNGSGAVTANNLASPNTFYEMGSGVYSFSGTITGNYYFEMDGTGTQTFSGASTSTEPTIIASGTEILDFSPAAAVSSNILYNNFANGTAANTLTFGGGTLQLTGKASTSNSQVFTTITSSGGDAIKLVANPTANNLLLTTGNITRVTGGTLDFTLPAGTQSPTNGVLSTVANSGTTGIIGGWATVGGADWAVSGATVTTGVTWSNLANGPIIFNGPEINGTAFSANTALVGLATNQLYYVVDSTGTTFEVATTPTGAAITDGVAHNGTNTISFQGNITALGTYTAYNDTTGTNTNNYLLTGSGTANNTQTTNSLKINPSASGGTLAIATGQTLTLSSGGLLFTGSQDYTITGPGTLASGFNGELLIQQFAAANNLTIGAVINSANITKSGPGTLTLTGLNTGTGTITLNGGVTDINSFAVGSASALGAGTATAAINFNGGTLQYASGYAGNADITQRLVTINSGGATIDTNGNNVTFANSFGRGGLGGLTKTGAGTLTIGNIAAYVGPTVISGGVLSIGGAASIASQTLTPTIVSGATLTFGSTSGVAVGQTVVQTTSTSPLILGTGILAEVTVTAVSGNTVTLSQGVNGLAAGSNVTFLAFNALGNSGPLSSSSLGLSTYTPENLVLNGGVLQYTGANSNTTSTDRLFTVTTAGGSGIDASGLGSLTFSSPGKLAFTGTTTLNLMGNTNGVGTGNGTGILNPVISDAVAGAVFYNGANSVNGVTSVAKSGSGTWVLTGINTYSGVTTITGGTLALVSANNNIASSSRISVGAGAVLDVSGVANGFVAGAQTLTGSGGTVVGNVEMDPASTFLADLTLGPATPTLNFAGNLILDPPSLTLNGAPDGTDTYILATYAGSLTGTFDFTAPVGYNIDYGTGNDSEISLVPTAVPEPASLAMLGLGAAGLLMRRRRRS